MPLFEGERKDDSPEERVAKADRNENDGDKDQTRWLITGRAMLAQEGH
jgi:hypothetical protein